jgi:hypothetical protein
MARPKIVPEPDVRARLRIRLAERHANPVLQALGLIIVPKDSASVLPPWNYLVDTVVKRFFLRSGSMDGNHGMSEVCKPISKVPLEAVLG